MNGTLNTMAIQLKMVVSQFFKILLLQIFLVSVVADLSKKSFVFCVESKCGELMHPHNKPPKGVYANVSEEQLYVTSAVKYADCVDICFRHYATVSGVTVEKMVEKENVLSCNAEGRVPIGDGKLRRVDFTQRRRAEACGKLRTYDIKNGRPINPAGATGIRGKGELPFWGPNVVSQLAFIRLHKGRHEFLGNGNSSGIFFENFGPDAATGFKSGLLGDMIKTARDAAIFDKLKRKKGEDTILKEVTAGIKKRTKILVSGSFPSVFNADNAWLEIQIQMVLCEKKSTGFCGAGLDAVAEKYSLQWIPVPVNIDLGKMVRIRAVTDRNMTVTDVPLYSIFCRLEERLKKRTVFGYVVGSLTATVLIVATLAAVAVTLGLPAMFVSVGIEAMTVLCVVLLRMSLRRIQ